MYHLSPSLLNLYQDCSRCLWVEIHEKLKHPKGSPFSASLKSGMYLALKKYADEYRTKDKLPPELQKKINGVFLPDQELMNKWRDEHSGLCFADEKLDMTFCGGFDECIVREEKGEKIFTPLLFKIRGFGIDEEKHDNHSQLQLDCFELLLKKNDYATSGTGYLVYYIPEAVRESGVVKFNVQVIQFVSESMRARNLIKEVVGVLNGKIPKKGQDCEYCSWGGRGAQIVR